MMEPQKNPLKRPARLPLRADWDLLSRHILPQKGRFSLLLLLNGKSWYFWLGGFLCLLYSAFGYWVDYVRKIAWRKPVVTGILIPYVTLYLATLMFYWWPLYRLSMPLWIVYTGLYIIAMVLNIRSH